MLASLPQAPNLNQSPPQVSCASFFSPPALPPSTRDSRGPTNQKEAPMARARKPPPFAAAERFLGFHHLPGSVAPSSDGDDLPDLAESDVWYSPAEGPTATAAADREGEGWELGERPARGSNNGPRRVGGLSRTFADGRQVAASAPVEVPAWPSRYTEPEPEPYAEDKDDNGADGWVPPHVYLARRQARASVVEGAGRTLKGRDASRVRDAVWSRTGFGG